jgi:hypothetical protein
MSKRSAIILIAVILGLAAGFVCLAPSKGALMARAEKQGPADASYSVTVRRYDHRYRTELLYRGKFIVSSYEFYQRSVPPTNAVISWPRLDEFVVTFNKRMTVRCTWDSMSHDKVLWERGPSGNSGGFSID